MTDLSLIRDAGAMIGPSSAKWWTELVTTYGAEAVETVVAELKEQTGQPVNVAKADQRLKADAKTAADAADDAAEDLGQRSDTARTLTFPARSIPTASLPPVSTATKPTPAATEASSPAIAAGSDGDDRRSLIVRMDAAIVARGITKREAARQIGIHEVSLHQFRSGKAFGVKSAGRIEAWLGAPPAATNAEPQSSDGDAVPPCVHAFIAKADPPRSWTTFCGQDAAGLKTALHLSEVTCLHCIGVIKGYRSDLADIAELLPQDEPTPIPMLIACPLCHQRHVDEGEWAIRPHHTHACQHCGHVWRHAIVPTVGVQFLPGFKNETEPAL